MLASARCIFIRLYVFLRSLFFFLFLIVFLINISILRTFLRWTVLLLLLLRFRLKSTAAENETKKKYYLHNLIRAIAYITSSRLNLVFHIFFLNILRTRQFQFFSQLNYMFSHFNASTSGSKLKCYKCFLNHHRRCRPYTSVVVFEATSKNRVCFIALGFSPFRMLFLLRL